MFGFYPGFRFAPPRAADSASLRDWIALRNFNCLATGQLKSLLSSSTFRGDNMTFTSNTILVLTILFASCMALAQESQDSTKHKNLLSFGAGLDFIHNSASRQYSFSLSFFHNEENDYWGARALDISAINGDVWKYDNLIEVSPLYGKGLSWGNARVFVASGVSLVANHLSGGTRTNPGAMFSAYTYQKPITRFTVGIPVHVQFTHKVGSKSGISLLTYANLNPIQSFFGTTLNVLILW